MPRTTPRPAACAVVAEHPAAYRSAARLGQLARRAARLPAGQSTRLPANSSSCGCIHPGGSPVRVPEPIWPLTSRLASGTPTTCKDTPGRGRGFSLGEAPVDPKVLPGLCNAGAKRGQTSRELKRAHDFTIKADRRFVPTPGAHERACVLQVGRTQRSATQRACPGLLASAKTDAAQLGGPILDREKPTKLGVASSACGNESRENTLKDGNEPRVRGRGQRPWVRVKTMPQALSCVRVVAAQAASAHSDSGWAPHAWHR